MGKHGQSAEGFTHSSRLSLILSLAILFIVGVCGFLINNWLDRYLHDRSIVELKRVNQQVVDMVDAYAQILENSTTLLGKDFASRFPNPVRNENRRVTSGGEQLPELRSNGLVLNNQDQAVDEFSNATAATATIFVRDKDDFFRITTSVKQENGQRALGTALGHHHPAYTALMEGHSYTGQATLFGHRFMTSYQPLRDASGTIVAAAYVGIDFTESLKVLKDRMLAVKIGETGYIFAIDAQEHPGQAVVHPNKDETSAPEFLGQKERGFILDMLAQGSGVIHYRWANPSLGEAAPRDKIVVFRRYEPWGWIVAASAYEEEIHSGLHTLHSQLLGFGLLITISLLVATLIVTRQFHVNEKNLRQATRAAEAASRAKSDFLATISHEIRTPLNGVFGMSQLLLCSNLDKDQQEYAQQIKNNGEALLKIINDILDFSKIEVGSLSLEETSFDPSYLISSIYEVLAVSANEKGLELILDIQQDLPPLLLGDEGRLRQVLFNLVGNAIKFTVKGRILLSITCPQEGRDQCRLNVEIVDTGIGIPADKIEAMFAPFTQADTSTTRGYGGTGLGLPIAKRLLELMGGTLGAVSVLGEGSTFYFSVPCRIPEDSKAADSQQ